MNPQLIQPCSRLALTMESLSLPSAHRYTELRVSKVIKGYRFFIANTIETQMLFKTLFYNVNLFLNVLIRSSYFKICITCIFFFTNRNNKFVLWIDSHFINEGERVTLFYITITRVFLFCKVTTN